MIIFNQFQVIGNYTVKQSFLQFFQKYVLIQMTVHNTSFVRTVINIMFIHGISNRNCNAASDLYITAIVNKNPS